MELKKLHMGTMSYGTDTMDEIVSHIENAYEQNRPNYNRAGASASIQPGGGGGIVGISGKGRRDISSRIKDIVQALALCHNVTPVLSSDGTIAYQASSPDEVAIVKWTEQIGVALVFRDIREIHIRVSSSDIHEFEVLRVFPFTSESKRMGIVVRDKLTNEITFYQKGADVVMSRIVQYNDWLDEECGNMAREGLRTLVVAKKRLSEQAYEDFRLRYEHIAILPTKVIIINCYLLDTTKRKLAFTIVMRVSRRWLRAALKVIWNC